MEGGGNRRRLAGAAAALLLALLALPAAAGQLAARERAARQAELAEAKARWAASAPARYRLDLEENGCRYVSHVRGDTATIEGLQTAGGCAVQPASVAALFDIAARDGSAERLCDTRGCPCESVTGVRAVYDPARGYPLRVSLAVELRPAWLSGDLWAHLLAERALPPCLSRSISEIRTLGLAEEP